MAATVDSRYQLALEYRIVQQSCIYIQHSLLCVLAATHILEGSEAPLGTEVVTEYLLRGALAAADVVSAIKQSLDKKALQVCSLHLAHPQTAMRLRDPAGTLL